MHKPPILVTGATGKTGAAIIAALRAEEWPVRALVHRRDARSAALERLGAEIFVGDLYDAAQLSQAMRGMIRAYYCPPFQPFAVQSAAAFVTAARQSKLEAVIGLSQWLASPDHPSLHTRQVWLAEQLLSQLPGIAHVTLNPGYFADNYLRLLDFTTLLGIFPVLTGDSRNAPPANEDIARCAVALLRAPDRHAGKRYRPTGPTLLSAYDMAGIIRQVVGGPVLPVPMPWWMLTRAARLQGVSPFDLLSLRYYVEDHRQGAFALDAPNQVVAELTGRPAEDFATTVQRYAALPFARKTLSNRLRAVLNFNRVPFSRGYDLDRFEEAQFHPLPPVPRLAMSNPAWLEERRRQSDPPIDAAARFAAA
jgi:NAD(P)H dehydrogenase (quinone)